MPNRAFLFSITGLIILVVLTSPPLVRPILYPEPSPTATATVAPPSPTATATLDPFANVPTATPPSSHRSGVISSLPRPASDILLPSFTPTPSPPALVLLPHSLPVPKDAQGARPLLLDEWMPAHLQIPALNEFNISIEPVGLIPSELDPTLFEPGLPPAGTVGWLTTSAAVGKPGNTVLVDRHNLLGDLHTVETGEEIRLHLDRQLVRFVISQTLTLDQNQPLQSRPANAQLLQPTDDERLTLISPAPAGERIIVIVATASP